MTKSKRFADSKAIILTFSKGNELYPGPRAVRIAEIFHAEVKDLF